MARETSVRERSSHLLLQLCGVTAKTSDGEPTDNSVAAHRLLGHAALTLTQELGGDALHRASRALPWLAVFVDWLEREPASDALARDIVARRMVSHLGVESLRRRLERVGVERERSVLRRAPGRASSAADTSRADALPGERRVEVLVAIQALDEALAELCTLDDAALSNRLIDDSTLLAAAMEMFEEPLPHPDAARLATLFPASTCAGAAAHSRRAVTILATIEASDFTRVPEELEALGERSRRFELSLGQNMQRHGLLEAVRAALAFGPAADAVPGEDDTTADAPLDLRQFAVFEDDAALESLTLALMAMRSRCLGHLRGALPLEALSPWVAYLRGDCVELAESRGITLHEATHFAHYCLHLMNLCDLAAHGLHAVNESTRRALLDIEDELKEYALAGQRVGLSDRQVSLERFERACWSTSGDAAYVADRLARLRGAWRHGIRPGPVGAPARLDDALFAASLAMVESLRATHGDDAPPGDRTIAALASLLRHCQITGAEILEALDPADGLCLLTFGLVLARDLPGIDITAPFRLDLGALAAWYRDPAAHGLNPRLLAQLLDRMQVTDLLNHDALSTGAPRTGLRGRIDTTTTPPCLVLEFVADAELHALLTLMSHSSSDSGPLRALLDARLDELLDASYEPPPLATSPANAASAGPDGSKAPVSP